MDAFHVINVINVNNVISVISVINVISVNNVISVISVINVINQWSTVYNVHALADYQAEIYRGFRETDFLYSIHTYVQKYSTRMYKTNDIITR